MKTSELAVGALGGLSSSTHQVIIDTELAVFLLDLMVVLFSID